LKIIIYFAFLYAQIVGWNCTLFSSQSDTCNELKDSFRSTSIIFNKPISVGFNRPIGNLAENIWISFDSLKTDSRCPIGVTCFWEGNAEISLRLFNNEFNIPFNLNTNPSFINDTTIHSYHIELIDLSPYPHIDCQFTEDDYSATLIISN